jgi:hypothetical protein
MVFLAIIKERSAEDSQNSSHSSFSLVHFYGGKSSCGSEMPNVQNVANVVNVAVVTRRFFVTFTTIGGF